MLAAVVVGVVGFGLSTGSAFGHAAPPEHDHFLTVPGNGRVVQVGPPVCGAPHLHEAFHNFHRNVHVGTPTSTGPIRIHPVFCALPS